MAETSRGKGVDAAPVVRVKRLSHAEGLALPERLSAGSAGADLCAAIREPILLEAGQRALVPTGLIVELPAEHEGQVRPRSGLAIRHGVTVINAPGTIDSDYRGEVGVALVNHGCEPYTIRRGDRIAQLVVSRICPVRYEESENLTETERGAGGFGSTGIR